MRALVCSAFRSAGPATKTTTGSLPTFSRTATSSTAMPVFPSIGNHDGSETEERDDRAQVEDNFYLRERLIGGEEAAGRASFSPGLFYRVSLRLRASSSSPRHVERSLLPRSPSVRVPEALGICRGSVSGRSDGRAVEDSVLLIIRPSAPGHSTTTPTSMQRLVPLFQRSGVKAVFCGPRAQLSALLHRRDRLLHHGSRRSASAFGPDQFAEAHTVTWATECHFLLVDVSGDRMMVRALGEVDAPGQVPSDLARFDLEGQRHAGPIEVYCA